MDLRFVPPQLRKLDRAGTEVLVAAVASDERPPRGLAGLVDWRLAGRVSAILASGFATGSVGEVLLVPGKPKLPFDKILLLGIGRRAEFAEPVYRVVLDRILSTLEGLRARTAVVELPGRHMAAISAERAAGILIEAALGRQEHDVWTLVEPPDAQRAMTQVLQEKRRVRSI